MGDHGHAPARNPTIAYSRMQDSASERMTWLRSLRAKAFNEPDCIGTIPVPRPQRTRDDRPFLFDKYRCRQPTHHESQGHIALLIKQYRQSRIELFHELLKARSFMFSRNREDRYVARIESAAQSSQCGHFFLARSTPGRPEIENEYFAPQLREVDGLAVYRGKREGGKRSPGTRSAQFEPSEVIVGTGYFGTSND